MAGFVGKSIFIKTGKKLSRITATDAAGPGFENVNPESRLDKHDARFVDVIHTDTNYYGIFKPIGHVDFYVNEGKNQPGCPSRQIDGINFFLRHSGDHRNVEHQIWQLFIVKCSIFL